MIQQQQAQSDPFMEQAYYFSSIPTLKIVAQIKEALILIYLEVGQESDKTTGKLHTCTSSHCHKKGVPVPAVCAWTT